MALLEQADHDEAVLEWGVDKDVANKDGTATLHWASKKGHLDVLTLLHKHGVNLDATDDTYGMTALMWTADKGKADCAEALLDWGADKDAVDKNGDTALHWAAHAPTIPGVKRGDSEEVKQGKWNIQALLEQADRGEAGTAAEEGVPPAAP